MKKILSILLTVMLLLSIAACSFGGECVKLDVPVSATFQATVLEISGDTILVEPLEGAAERNSADKISFSKRELEQIGAIVGSIVEITYDGNIMESYPAQIQATSWRLVQDLRHMAYTQQWLDKETAEKQDNDIFDHIVITEIYSNCFFAVNAIPLPTQIKLNGTLTEDWCVGDQVQCTYENTYYDKATNRIEADMLTIQASDWQPQPGVAYKPVIYLYPEEETQVSVRSEEHTSELQSL